MFARVVNDEQEDVKDNPVKVFSIAPGVVDTEMQDEIREVEPENFRDLDRFVQLKKEGLLVRPEDVAKRYAEVMNHPDQFANRVMDLRDQ